MKTGVQSVTIKLIDPEGTDSLSWVFDHPDEFTGIEVSGEGEIEIEVSDRKFLITEHEGTGTIGPWTRLQLRVDTSETPVDLIIALDTSYSMISDFEDTTRFDLAVDGILELIGQKSKKLTVGIMAYGVDWEMSQDLTEASTFTKKKQSDLKKELDLIKHKGKAAAGTALNGSSEVFSIKGSSDLKAVLLLTDGADEIGPNPLKEADNLVARGMYIYPFYFGEETDQKSLTIFERIAAKSHTTLFSLHNAAEEEKRRLIRASLRSADPDEGENGTGSIPVVAKEVGSEEDIQSAIPVPEEGESEDLPDTDADTHLEDTDETPSVDSSIIDSGDGSDDANESASDDPIDAEAVISPDERSGAKLEGAVSDEGFGNDSAPETGDAEVGGSEDLVIPSGTELLIRQLRDMGTGFTFLVQEGGGELPPGEEESDVQVIKAGTPIDDVDEEDASNELTHRPTPKIIDAIKNFIEWVKNLIW